VKWGDVRRVLSRKLEAKPQKGTKHDFWFVYCGDRLIGRVKDVHGEGEMKPWEFGGVASSLKINEHTLRQLVGCTMSKEELCANAK
jgi:hypothetical protein